MSVRDKESIINQYKKDYEEIGSNLTAVSATKDESMKNYERLNLENNYHKDVIEENKKKIAEL